jgi:beta-phosphoglucomutase
MKQKAFIFDLDGVIVDTAKYHYLAWKKIADRLGIDFTHEHNELLKGVSRGRSLDIILGIGQVEASQEDKDAWLTEKNDDYMNSVANMAADEILDGVMPVLEWLKANKQGIALGSASKNARPILEKVGIIDYFDAIVDGNDVTNAKPDPEVFLRAAALVGKPASEAIVFEDSMAGIHAANIAGMASVGIGDRQILQDAHHNFGSFAEIDTHFLEILVNS